MLAIFPEVTANGNHTIVPNSRSRCPLSTPRVFAGRGDESERALDIIRLAFSPTRNTDEDTPERLWAHSVDVRARRTNGGERSASEKMTRTKFNRREFAMRLSSFQHRQTAH